ncbi:TrbC/VirB2 family protein [Bacillus cereus]
MNLPKLNLLESVKSSLPTVVYNDFFDSVSSALTSWTGKLQGIGLAVIIFCVCIIAFMFMFGEGPSRTAKKWLMYIVVGGILLWGAGTLGSTIQGVTAGF